MKVAGLFALLHLEAQLARTSHGENDLSSRASLFQIPDSLGGFAQRVDPVDDRCDLAGFDELLEDDQCFALSTTLFVRDFLHDQNI